MSKKSKNNSIPSAVPAEEAFLTNPVASANECTGYVVKVPENEAMADSYSNLCNVPVTPISKKEHKRKKQ